MSSSLPRKKATATTSRRRPQVEVVMPPLPKKIKNLKQMLSSSEDEETGTVNDRNEAAGIVSETDEDQESMVERKDISDGDEDNEEEEGIADDNDEEDEGVTPDDVNDRDWEDSAEEEKARRNKTGSKKKQRVSSSSESLEIPLVSSTAHHETISTSHVQSKLPNREEMSDDIVDDIREIARAQRESKGKEKGKGKIRATSPLPAVTYILHKIRHPGTSKTYTKKISSYERTPSLRSSTPIEPLTPSPKKKTKVYRSEEDSDDNMVDDETVMTMTPVSRLTKKMDTNQLRSPKKFSKIRGLSKDAMKDMKSERKRWEVRDEEERRNTNSQVCSNKKELKANGEYTS
ncbi:hypothetical protein BDY19DRAFT_997880 [Irpex rosettiformis]|uniref:Uncharacterized protein n=1 Tax=Irpex rosettiformis TaxID=378272 RepID=A0ACB8TQ77_9APHY|nr:hypothetical protein BDY19DRAFT_997880 [Irpex rosettiformis]